MAIDYTPSEMMAFRASKELQNHDIVFVGIGLPNLACVLARETHAPDLFMIYESGAVGTLPDRLPISIGDPCLVTGSLSIVSQADIFQMYLQAGRIEVGFLGGAQVDRYGNLNTTFIGKSYQDPKVRLPGSGGACEIATHSKRLLIMMRISKKSFVEKCDYVTSPGQRYNDKTRKELGLPGEGPSKIITDLGVLTFDGQEFVLTETYPGVSKEQVQAACGWPLKCADTLTVTPYPEAVSLSLLRDKLDPTRMYL